ncbi:MAG: DUF2855 family protein [Polaromonas sp.]|nr:DUF2855 family protein [Polaromonas sp.]
MTSLNTHFQVLKTDLHQTRLTGTELGPLQDGEVRLAVQRFAFTANNITYAAFGDAMNYWKFFPTSDSAWGQVPVWGFADVTESACEGVAVGQRFYGYCPMASHVTLQPAKVTANGFYDAAPHRTELHPVYNQYALSSTDPLYSANNEDIQALLRPLFITSFLIDDFLADNDFFSATTMLLSSASSKTAYGTAFQLAQRSGVEVIGLTSAGNVDFCNSLGCYHRVLTYEHLDQIAVDAPCVYIDFAGNATLRRNIHSRFANLKYSCSIGGTHVEQLGGKGAGKDLLGVRATLFFAPAQIKKRSIDWGPEGLRDKLVAAWQAFTDRATQPQTPWLVAQQHKGTAAFDAAYQQVLNGSNDPRIGHILLF